MTEPTSHHESSLSGEKKAEESCSGTELAKNELKLQNYRKFEALLQEINGSKEEYMEVIGKKFGTDKITYHHYHRYYAPLLNPFRSIEGGAILEIGIQRGASLNFWLEYFPNSFVYGIDIGVSSAGPRFNIFKTDQSNVSELRRITHEEISHPVFFIIDDGSHLPEHQALSFDFLFEHLLLPGGIYVIEDIEVSYWTQGSIYGYKTQYGYRNPISIVELFKNLPDDINNHLMKEENRTIHDLSYGEKISKKSRMLVKSVTFGKNCIIITKKTREEVEIDNRTYRSLKRL